MGHSSVEMVVMWNVTDADTWVNRVFSGQRHADGHPMRPTLFDTRGQKKPAFHAVAASLHNASRSFNGSPIKNESSLCSPKS
jgi:GH35 family endo-1,4-beta-xylanase